MKGEEPMIHNSPNLVEIKLREDNDREIWWEKINGL
jgi:hypothetical protein